MSAEQNVTEVPVHPASQTSDEESFGGSGGYELDEDGQRVPHGMGQSKSSRRRRRKRKGKGSGDAPQASAQPNGQAGESAAPVVPAVQAGGAQPNFNGGQRQQ